MKFKAPVFLDQTTNKASVTLMFCWLMFWPAFISNIIIVKSPTNDNLIGWGASQISFFIAFVMYRMRRIDAVKATIQGNSIELSSTPIQKKDE